MYVTIAVFPKNLVDSKSTSLLKSFTNLYDIIYWGNRPFVGGTGLFVRYFMLIYFRIVKRETALKS